ncbi:MAG TPA: MFS transporter [Stenomitos sp.]
MRPSNPRSPGRPDALRRERWAWAMYDFANSGYATVVLTAVYNAYFVRVVAGSLGPGRATLLWTGAIALSNLLVLVTAPVIGALADLRAAKKRFLLVATAGCILCTALLGWAGQGALWEALLLLFVANFCYGTGEDLIAAFLPELAEPSDLGRLSGFGWTVGYAGGLLTLGLCLAIIDFAEAHGRPPTDYVPHTLFLVAVMYGLGALPSLLWLKERGVPGATEGLMAGFRRLGATLRDAARFQDLFRFLPALVAYNSGLYTVVVIAAVYAQAVMGLTVEGSLGMVLVVNVAAAAGAFGVGQLQDRFGSVPVLTLTLVVWLLALAIAYLSTGLTGFWVAANLIGLALGSCQSAGRALIGRFTPPGREAEFFGLWGLAVKLSAVLGPLSYGLFAYVTGGNHKVAMLSTATYFLLGLWLLRRVDERRGMRAAGRSPASENQK